MKKYVEIAVLDISAGRSRAWTCGLVLICSLSKNLYDVAVLVTGDGDLREAVQAVKELGKHVEVATFRVGRSDELVQVADVCTELGAAEMTPLYLRP